jgi:hypothetical protein
MFIICGLREDVDEVVAERRRSSARPALTIGQVAAVGHTNGIRAMANYHFGVMMESY